MATVRDVARACGLSIATVSRVFNGSANVSEETRARVRKAAEKLDYYPNSAARSLTTSRTHTIGVLLPDLYGEFFSEVIRGLDYAARQASLHILLSSAHNDGEALLAAARSLRGRVDGLVVMAPDSGSAEAIHRIASQFPVVLLNPGTSATRCSTISIDNREGARSVVAHLVRLGHRRIAIILGPRGNIDAQQRREGYRRALAAARIAPAVALEIPGDFTEAGGYRAGKLLLQMQPRPSAVFAANDNTAIGLLGALREARIRVPQDVAVAGFDDIAISKYVTPPLTTVRVDAYGLGERAIALWLQIAAPPGGGRPPNGGAPARHVVLATALVVRKSCGSSAGSFRLEGSKRAGGRRVSLVADATNTSDPLRGRSAPSQPRSLRRCST